MMGAGKSTVGKALAKRLGRQFIDTDHEIEAMTGVKIPMIFEIEGESGFRRREHQVLEEASAKPNLILGTGGGIVLTEENRKLLKTRGHVVYLMASAEDLYNRTRHDKGRPLLQTANPKERLKELCDQRDPLYKEIAHTVIETGRQPVHVVVQTIIKALKLSTRIAQNHGQSGTGEILDE